MGSRAMDGALVVGGFRVLAMEQGLQVANAVAILGVEFMVTPGMPPETPVVALASFMPPLPVATVSLDVDIPWEDNLLLPIQQEFITLFMDVPADALDRSVSLAGLGMEEFWAVARQWACMG